MDYKKFKDSLVCVKIDIKPQTTPVISASLRWGPFLQYEGSH
jgi:hypothetical protein